MKKGLLALTGVVLTGCMLVSLAGCGAASKAKNMRGEEVTQDVWDSAMAETAFSSQTGSAALPVVTVADETVEAPNFKAEYEMKYKVEASTEGASAGDTQIIEAANLSVDMSMSATLVVADNAVHITLTYDFKLDGSDNLLQLLGMDKEAAGSGKAEVYLSYANGMQLIIKDDAGNWVNASLDSDQVAEAVQMAVSASMGMADQSALVGAFSEFEYSADQKGYVFADTDLQISGGSGSIGAAATAVFKLKDNALAAIYAESSAALEIPGVTSSGSSQMGLVYTYGGQSVTLPSVS